MSRSVILLSLATLSMLAACVDLRLPSKVSQCEQNNNCTDGTGGTGGSSAKSGGSMSRSPDAGVDASSGGRGGSGGTIASTGGTSSGTGGASSTAGSTGGTGGSVTGGSATGGTSGSPDAGSDLIPDSAIDTPVVNPDVPLDTETKLDTADTNKPKPEAGPEPGPEVSPDLPPDRPDTAFDGPSCIQSFKSNGYALASSDGGIKACSECKTNSGNSLENYCKGMIDCLVASWVCNVRTSSCWTNCRNNTPGADMVVDDCAAALVSKACP